MQITISHWLRGYCKIANFVHPAQKKLKLISLVSHKTKKNRKSLELRTETSEC